MDAASPQRIESLLARLASGVRAAEFHAASASGLVIAKLARSKLSLEEVHRLSSVFLDERRQSARKILGPQGYVLEGVDFVFFPVPESFVSVFVGEDATTILLSLGLVETLRLSVAAGQLDSCIGSIASDPALIAGVGSQRVEKMLTALRMMTRYFNAMAVLQFRQPARLPDVSSLLSVPVRHRVDIVLEAVLMFLLLHEMGHVDFHRQIKRDSAVAKLVWELEVPENINAAKAEELHADAYALRAVPVEFHLPLVHAATFFLNLYNYVDASAEAASTTHPISVNRIASLYAAARHTAAGDAVGHRAVQQAIRLGAGLWTRPDRAFSLPALQRFAERLGKVDWGPAQQALMLLADRTDGA